MSDHLIPGQGLEALAALNAGWRCPICERGTLLQVDNGAWDCSRPSCNNQFFHDTDGTLNVRDKPRTPLVARLWNALAASRRAGTQQ